MKAKIIEWIKRYAPAEVLSIITTFIAAGLTFSHTENHVAAALAATWGGNAGFFGYILTLDIFRSARESRLKNIPYKGKDLWINIRGLLVEFGITEIADSFFIRPFLMYYLPILTGNFSMGILLAKVAADITFYIPAIFFYEINKKYHRKNF
ncbi:MAG TPA: hypothetical protein VNW99_03190 [Cytophagaceae bacterium]|jgi:hypothetical protein|nr:hypothetical protein [Cytophagaceae bacterium]